MVLPTRRRAVVEVLAVGVAYYAAARLGLLLQLPGTHAPAVWPASGIGLGAMLLLGVRVWPGVAAGAVLANLLTFPATPTDVSAAVIIAAGSTLEQLTAWALIRRFSGTDNPFERVRHALWFLAATVVAGGLSATVGVTTLHLTGLIGRDVYSSVWMTWLVGVVASMIVCAPAIYAWGRHPRPGLPFLRQCELGAMVGVALLLGELVFGRWGTVQVALTRPYQPLLLWAAFRFGQREMSTLAVIASVQAVSHTWLAMKLPAGGGSATAMATLLLGTSAAPQDWLRALQFFLCASVAVALVIAAAVAERDQAEVELREMNQSLEKRVQERTSMMEATNQQLEAQIHERLHAERQLRASLEEKETLLREVHHRVKNNLSVVSSLLYLEAVAAHDMRTTRALEDAQHRVRSIGLVHDELYQSGSLAAIDMRQYLERLTSYLCQSYPIASRLIAIIIDVDTIVLNADTAIPCGLIFTELLTNAFKHGYRDDRSGTITVRVRLHSNGTCELVVADDGAGISPEKPLHDSSTLGLRLVQLLTRQLDGTFVIKKKEQGIDAVLEFPTQGIAPA